MDVDVPGSKDYYPRYIPSVMRTANPLKLTLEVAGLMVQPKAPNPSQPTLLRPKNLRLANGRDAHPWLADHYDWDNEEDDDPEAYLAWDALEMEEVDHAKTWDALPELLRLVHATPREIEAYIHRWGMLAGDWDTYSYGDRFGPEQAAMTVNAWRELADFTNRLMALLALTAQGELVDESALDYLQRWEPEPHVPEFELPENHRDSDFDYSTFFQERGFQSYTDYLFAASDIAQERRWRNLLDERATGHGVEQQRRLLAQILTGLLGVRDTRFEWDERGRHMIMEAIGLDEIVFSHVATIFLSPEIDVLVCSVCGTAFLFDESTHERRPRFGVRTFCSDACRREGKRESNRLSWRRNSDRWRRRRSGGDAKDGEEG